MPQIVPQIIVRLENITVKNKPNEPILIRASSGKELLEQVYERYNIFPEKLKENSGEIQIWSAPMGTVNRKRLDMYDIITDREINGYIRFAKIPVN